MQKCDFCMLNFHSNNKSPRHLPTPLRLSIPPKFNHLKSLAASISTFPSPSAIRHVLISHNPPLPVSVCQSPVTGAAIYLSTTPTILDASHKKWSSIAPSVPVFIGIPGGYVIKPVNGYERSFIALMGWESTGMHEAYIRRRI
jgi:hypothetical protein